MTSAFGTFRGFTLVEVLVALMIIATAFTALLELLSGARLNYAQGRDLFEKMIYLDTKLKLGEHEDLSVKREPVPDFPAIREAVYSYEDVFFIRYEPK
jgi:prepilin-type N-terminal cleavage/methylation domain-containing protein